MGIAVSYLLRSWSPFLSTVLLMIALFLTRRLWDGRWFRKIALVFGIAVSAVATWFSFQNHFEWFFKPLPDPAYARISQADFMTDQDMVLAVKINGESAAYPVRFLAYHHVIMDEVGGLPIVATY
jgi:hypothetical protein